MLEQYTDDQLVDASNIITEITNEDGDLMSEALLFLNYIGGTLLDRRRVAVCEHEWTDARNKAVKSGEICLKCGDLRAGNQTSVSGEPKADSDES